MSFKEIIFFRIPQQVQYYIIGKKHKNIKFSKEGINVNQNFKLVDYSRDQISKFLDDKSTLNEYAFFDTKIDLFKDIDWLKDYKNNIISSPKYYGNIGRQDFKFIGDIKYVSEPSRFYFLPFLALKESQTKENENKYHDLISKILNTWKTQNPYLQSVHWTSGIEVGIRSVNLVYTHMVLNVLGLLTTQLDYTIKEIIQYNYHFLKNHLSLYSSANNHLVAELAGLVIISSYFENKEMKKQKQKWRKKLYHEILNQVNEDGVNVELSTHYHAEVTDHFLNALLFIKRADGNVVPNKIEEQFSKMFDFLDHVKYNGNKTIYGDNDEGFLINPYLNKDFSIYDSLLRSAEIEYKKHSYSLKTSKHDLRNYLIFGDEIFNTSNENNNNNHRDTIFEKSGYAFFYDNLNHAKMSFDFGEIGDKISAAHGHSDILHFTFEAFGEAIIIDAGTFQYHSRYEKQRAYFRGIKAHNTISINNEDQAYALSRMSWINTPEVELLEHKIDPHSSSISARHNAYKKFGITHNREITFNKKNKQIVVKDNILQTKQLSGNNTLQFYLNFNPKLNISHNKDTLIIKIKDKEIKIINKEFSTGKFYSGDKNNMLGWYSDRYDVIEKGKVFVISKNISSTLALTTKIDYEQ